VAVAPPPPRAAPPPPVVPPPAAAPGATLGVEPPAPPPSQSREMSGTRLAAWITGGAAVGALAFGTVEAFNAASKREAFNNHTTVYGGVPVEDCGTSNLSVACKPLKDAYDQAITLTVVGFVTAGALAVTSSVLFVYSSGHGAAREENGADHALTCVPSLGVRGLGCALRF